MLRLSESIRIFAAASREHFPKGIDGLVEIVRTSLGEDPLSGDLFCFFNRRHNQVKILVWDRNGFWILRKRLERGRFERINRREPWVEFDRVRFAMLLGGLDTKTARFHSYFAREIRISRRDDVGGRARLAE
jgi:transposase